MINIVAGILAHVDAGKTTLSEALLYKTGAVKQQGRVDKGDCLLDYNDCEKERGITVFSKEAVFEPTGGITCSLVDTPGHDDFGGEMERVLNVLDLAILVISLTEGLQSHTKVLWNLLKRYNIPVIIFLNKNDMPLADREAVFKEIQGSLSGNVLNFNMSEGEPVESCLEDMASCNESLMEKYLSGERILQEEIVQSFGKREFFPCVSGSALRCGGIDKLLEVFCYLAHAKEKTKETCGYCYKITRDNEGKRLCHLKIMGGKISLKQIFAGEKINELRIYSGSRYRTVQEAVAGDLIVIPGTSIKQGVFYACDGESGVFGELKADYPCLTEPPMLESSISYSVSYPEDIDRTVMAEKLKGLEEELPELKLDLTETDIRISLMGRVQTEIIKKLILERYGILVDFSVGEVEYRETIEDIAEGIGHFEPLRHYAEVHLKLEPLEPGTGIQIATELSEDLLDINWQKLILSHIKEKRHLGVLTGSPVTDIKFTLIGGKAHNKHTEGGDFRQASYRAIRQGLMMAKSVLLEPCYVYQLTIPENTVGRALTDLDRMKATVTITENRDGFTTLEGKGPVFTLHGYSEDLKAYTSGKGTITLTPGGYQKCHNSEAVIEKKAYNPDKDIRNPAGSVFCIHGAGTNISWEEVPGYAHIPPCLNNTRVNEDVKSLSRKQIDLSIDADEIDKIIGKTGKANSGRRTGGKGISNGMYGKRREKIKTVPAKEVIYKGTAAKPRFLLVDGYNVIFADRELAGLAAKNIDGARDSLLELLTNYKALINDEIIVVFDAYRVQNHAVSYSDYQNIHVVFTATAQTADKYIEHFSHINRDKYTITVATSDGLEQIITRSRGCEILSSRDLMEIMAKSRQDFNERFNVK